MNWQERAENAEAELARLAKQEPVVRIDYGYTGGCVTGYLRKGVDAYTVVGKQLYAEPVPAVAAPAVPEEWRNIVIEMLGWWDDHTMTLTQGKAIGEKARALLQSAPQSGSEPVAIIRREVRHD